jgi:hypothetical protein
MNRFVTLAVLAAFAPSSLAHVSVATPNAPLAASAVASQDPKPDERADVKEWIAKLLEHAGKRGKEDQEAVKVIDEHLLKEFETFGPKDRAAVVKALDRVFNEKRQETEDGVRQNSMFIASAVALGRMGPESAPVLISWIGHKTHKKDVLLQRKLIESLGRTKVEAGRVALIKLITDDEPQVQAAAIQALGEYEGVELKLRKDTFEAVLKHAMGLYGQMQSNQQDPIARERYDAVVGPAITTLKRLSGHDESALDGWQRWWNKNKKEDWDKA